MEPLSVMNSIQYSCYSQHEFANPLHNYRTYKRRYLRIFNKSAGWWKKSVDNTVQITNIPLFRIIKCNWWNTVNHLPHVRVTGKNLIRATPSSLFSTGILVIAVACCLQYGKQFMQIPVRFACFETLRRFVVLCL